MKYSPVLVPDWSLFLKAEASLVRGWRTMRKVGVEFRPARNWSYCRCPARAQTSACMKGKSFHLATVLFFRWGSTATDTELEATFGTEKSLEGR